MGAASELVTGRPLPADVEARSPRWTARLRPLLDLALVAWLIWLFDAFNNLAPVRQALAVHDGDRILALERSLHLAPEHTLNTWLSAQPALRQIVVFWYENVHIGMTLAVLGWLWWKRRDLLGVMEATLLLGSLIALAVFWSFPVAPPRMLSGGYVDLVASVHHLPVWQFGSVALHANQLCALPSLHVAWATWCSIVIWQMSRRAWVRTLAVIYPLLTTFAVMSTANHYLADAVSGAAITLVVFFALSRGPLVRRARRSQSVRVRDRNTSSRISLFGGLVDVFVSGASHCSERCREYWTYRHGSSAIREEGTMEAIAVRDRHAGPAGLFLTELPYPRAAENDVIVRVYAAGFTRGELAWAGTWTDRSGRDRTPSVPGHEVSGVVAGLGYGTTGLTVGQRVFGLADWTRNGTLAEYVAVEARNLAPLPMGVEHAVAAGAVISGLTAWQALFDHARLVAGQTVLIHGAAGGVGSIAVQLARQVGSRVIGTGRAADRARALDLGVDEFVDLETDRLEDAGRVDVVFDVIGGEILQRSTALVRAGGTLVTIAEPPTIQPENGRAMFFVVEADRSQLAELAQRLRDGRLTSNVGAVRPLAEAPATFGPDAPRVSGKTIIRVTEGW